MGDSLENQLKEKLEIFKQENFKLEQHNAELKKKVNRLEEEIQAYKAKEYRENNAPESPLINKFNSILESSPKKPLSPEDYIQAKKLYREICYIKGKKQTDLETKMKRRADYDLLLIKDEILSLPKPDDFQYDSFWGRRRGKPKLKKIIKKLKQYEQACELNGNSLYPSPGDRNLSSYEYVLACMNIHGGFLTAIGNLIDWLGDKII